VTAGRLRAAIECVLDWAKARGYRDGDNPARWRGHLDKLLPARSKLRTVEHMPSMPYADVPAFLAELRQRTDTAARALGFTILTAVRTGDIRGQEREDAPPMQWEHVDLDAALWTIPKGKNGKEHRVPLSPSAVALLNVLPRKGDIVFPGHRPGKPISKGAMQRVLAEMGCDVTTHGMRASFKTWASERTHAAREVVEACLAHTISDALEAAYRRGDFLDKRRRLMTAWADYCGTPATAGTLVPLQKRA
jgi:integrase